jgi:hypothetical protein
MKVTINVSGMYNLEKSYRGLSIQGIPKAMRKGRNQSGIILKRNIRGQTPFWRGELKSNMRVNTVDDDILISMMGYARAIAYGTPPHDPSWSLKKWEKSEDTRLWLWAMQKSRNPLAAIRTVMLKGTNPNDFIERGIEASFPKIFSIIDENIGSVVRNS